MGPVAFLSGRQEEGETAGKKDIPDRKVTTYKTEGM